MKFIDSINKSSPLEILLFIIFVVYIIFPFDMPDSIAYIVESPLGIISIFCITVYLFFYTNPVLGILYIFVAYELLRRSSNVTARAAIIEYTPSQAKKDVELKHMNPPVEKTLEEEIIDVRAPVGKSSSIEVVNSDFKPVADRIVNGASLI